jgi:hypothetical protein
MESIERRKMKPNPTGMTKCMECNTLMNPIQRLVAPICMDCARKNAELIAGHRK